MKNLRASDAIFPIALLAFEAVGVRYWQVIFNDTTRWLFLAILFLAILLRGEFLAAFRGTSGAVLGAYLAWCLCTTMWSEVPQLSLMKSVALALSVPTLFAAGNAWTLESSRAVSLSFLLPIVGLSLFAGLFDPGASTEMGSITIYQGLSGNPNYLGSIVAMSFPYAIWQAYRLEAGSAKRLLWWCIVLALAVMLYRSGSRASMLAVLAMLGAFIVALSPARRIMAVSLIGVFALATVVALPALHSSLYERFILKGNTSEYGSVFFTRQDVWSESYAKAKEGGLIGGGYGVSIGDTTEFQGGLTAVGYGREKGNTQLAIWEETGIVGLVLYALFVVTMWLDLGFGFFKIGDGQFKVEEGLLLGATLGFTIHSVFEAWWGAPGSPEFAYFWAVCGAARGLMRRAALPGSYPAPSELRPIAAKAV